MRTISEIQGLLEKIPYINISSVTPEGDPWISPVWSVYDNEYNFYWTSFPDSQHSKNIEHKNNIRFVIYDSTVQSGGWGLYAEAQAFEITDQDELEKVLSIFYKKNKSTPRPLEDFFGDKPRRMYKAVVEKFWVNDYDKNRIPADFKTEVDLKK